MDDSCTTISYHQIERTIRPLRLVFWGSLVCFVDTFVEFGVNGNGWKFDIVNDALGMCLIAVGVRRLTGVDAPQPYPRIMHWVQVAAWFGFAEAILDHFTFDVPAVLSMLFVVLGLARMIAIVAFCYAMRFFCQRADLTRSEKSWNLTMRLFIFIFLIPLGIGYQIGMIAILMGKSFHVDIGPLAILLVVFVVPIVHFLISTSRMQREAQGRLRALSLQEALG